MPYYVIFYEGCPNERIGRDWETIEAKSGIEALEKFYEKIAYQGRLCIFGVGLIEEIF